MSGFEEIDAVEAKYCGSDGKPVLGHSFELLLKRWRDGPRDRETALRLLFLSWYACSEPAFLTGLDDCNHPALIDEAFASLGGEQSDDEELWFVVHVMTQVAPECFSLERQQSWAKIGATFGEKLGNRISRMNPGQFANRGAYGEYFAHQARGHFAHGAEEESKYRRDA